jgi:hypothetical protein
MKKEFGGLGIPNLQDLNICLVDSWIKGYNTKKNLISCAARIRIPLSFGRG